MMKNSLLTAFCILCQILSAQNLVIQNVTGPASARPGEAIALSITVSNTGTASTVPTRLHYVQKLGDSYGTTALSAQTGMIPALAPNQTLVLSYPLTLNNPIYPPNAKYSGQAGLYNNYWFDDYYVVASNGVPSMLNPAQFKFNISITFPTADIAVAVQPNKTVLKNDETWSATYTVKNNSNILAKQVFVNLGGFANLGRNYYSGLYTVNSVTQVAANTFLRTSGGESFSYGWEIFDLNPGESRQVTLQFSAIVSLYQTGPQHIFLYAPTVNPFSNVVDATPEPQGRIDITYNTTPMPDLVMANLNITNPTVEQGKILYYKFDLKNIGTATTGNFNVKAYLSREPNMTADMVQDGIVPTGNFAGGFTAFQVPAASTMRSPIGTGTYYLILRVDEDNQVAESNEFNNIIVSGPIQVINPNSCRYQDSLELVRLYQATNGANWINKWNLSTPIHTWFGVGLNPAGCVESLFLQGNHLSGTIPNLNMPELLALILSNNQLTGSIPNFNLPKLQAFVLSYNQLTGNIPNLNMPQLITLHLEANQLTGSIPNFNLTTVRDIYLSFNQLTGYIPNLNLPNLQTIDFQSNMLAGSVPNFNLPQLQLLFLQNNQLTGSIPSFNLGQLRVLYLNNNQLTGSIPTFNTPQLFYLQLNNNQLTGCLPASLHAVCAQLQNVNLSNNPGLTNQDINTFCNGNVGECVPNLPDLTITNLNLTQTTVQQGQILNYKFDLKNIGNANAPNAFNVKSYISRDNVLSSDDIQDGIIATSNFNAGFTSFQVAGASTMRSPIGTGQYYLILKADADNQVAESNENNNILVSLPFQVTSIANSCRYQDSLQLVQLYQTANGAHWINQWNLNTPIHTWFGVTLTAQGCVQNIELRANNLAGTIPNLNLPNLDVLSLAENALNGSIPALHLPLVQSVALGRNQLTGNIPYLNCPNLKGFYVPSNKLSGSIPNLNCPQLVFIDLSDNPLTGPIPNFNFPNLTGIVITNTQVTGTLPNFNFPKLTLLHLYNNQLTGTVPNFNFPLVENVFLHHNQFSGAIPAFNLPNANALLLDNNQFTGSIPDFNVPTTCFIRLNFNQLSGCIPVSLKKFCPFKAEMTNNPNLLNQNFETFCSANAGACQATVVNYCASKGNTPWNEWIAGVQFSNLNNPSEKQGYGDFTGVIGNVVRGSTYEFKLTQGYSWATDPSNATAQWRVWIDYNKNNVFEDTELAASGTRYTSTANITIPLTAPVGSTRMRISLKKTGAPTACEAFEKGEVEDYTVNITASGGYEKTQKIDNQSIANFNIFPNPTSQEAFLDLKDFENESVGITLFDVAGKAIWNQKVEKASATPHRLDVSMLSNGAYRVRLETVGKKAATQSLYILK